MASDRSVAQTAGGSCQTSRTCFCTRRWWPGSGRTSGRHPFKAAENIEANKRVFLDRLRASEEHINANYEVDSLCRGVVARLLRLKEKRGARLKH